MEYADLDVQEPSARGAACGVGRYLRLPADVAVLAPEPWPPCSIDGARPRGQKPESWPERRCLFFLSASTSFGDDHGLPWVGICPGAVMLHIEDDIVICIAKHRANGVAQASHVRRVRPRELSFSATSRNHNTILGDTIRPGYAGPTGYRGADGAHVHANSRNRQYQQVRYRM